MLWIAIAADLVAAQPVNIGSWFPDLQWEERVSKKGGHAITFVRVTVAPDGKPENCKIETTSGMPDLDSEACALIMKRARFKPARGMDGTPAYGILRKDILWADASAFQYSRPVDVELTISRLPKGIPSTNSFTLLFAVDEKGGKSVCKAPKRMNPTLAAIACKEVIENYPAIAAKTSAGAAVPSVQNVIVSFVAQ